MKSTDCITIRTQTAVSNPLITTTGTSRYAEPIFNDPYAIDEAIAHSTNLKTFDYILTQMGYEHCLSDSRKYWTIVPKGYKKPIRLKSLGENYTEDAIKRRLTENQKVLIVPFAKETVRVRQYRMPTREHKVKKVGGLYGLYLHYCYKLGYLPKYKKQNTARLHYLLKEDLLKLDKITQETRLLGRENISTDEQLFSYKSPCCRKSNP